MQSQRCQDQALRCDNFVTFGIFSGASAMESNPWGAKDMMGPRPEIWRLSSSVMGRFSPVSELLSDPARP